MFTQPLSAEEYRYLVDVKYRTDAHELQGWALHDDADRTRGWHPHEPGSFVWADADAAMRAFIPDTKKRRKFLLCGWTIVATKGIDDLMQLLAAARGEVPASTDPAPQ
jgi:hypothetical protein